MLAVIGFIKEQKQIFAVLFIYWTELCFLINKFILQRSSVKNNFFKKRIEAKVDEYLCLLKISTITID